MKNSLISIIKVKKNQKAVGKYFYMSRFILNQEHFNEYLKSGIYAIEDSSLRIFAKNSGKWGDSIQVAIANADDFNRNLFAFEGVQLDELFSHYPQWDYYNKEICIIVYYDGVVKESFIVSLLEEAKNIYGKSLFVEEVVNSSSQYIFVAKTTDTNDKIDSLLYSLGEFKQPINLNYGEDGEFNANNFKDSYDLYSNKDEVDIDIVIASESDTNHTAVDLVHERQDCLLIMGTPRNIIDVNSRSTSINNIMEWRDGLGYNSEFTILVGNYKYQYDHYNDVFRWVSLAGDVAGLRAFTNSTQGAWITSAGLSRGQIKNVKKLAFNPSEHQREKLYKFGINPVVTFPNQGTVMWGQRTLTDKPSNFKDAHIRGLFNVLIKAFERVSRNSVFEFNDTFTRNYLVNLFKNFLMSVYNSNGLEDFLIICDESNNTEEVKSKNYLVIDIYLKPKFVTEFVILRMTNTGSNIISNLI